MAEPLETLVYVNRLQKAEMASVFTQNAAFPSSGLRTSLQAAVADVCLDRLVRADGCLRFAWQIAASGEADEETLRAIVSRAYYSVHHSLRSMALWQNKWNPDGHEESIKVFRTLLEDNNFRHRCGLGIDAGDRVLEALANRHVADYSPYNVQRDPPDTRWLRITNGDWGDAAQFNLNLATELSLAAARFIGS